VNLAKNKLSVISAEIHDSNINNESCSLNKIFVSVEILFHKLRFTIEYKANDINNIQLKHKQSSVEYPLINSICVRYNIKFDILMETIKKKSKAQPIFDEYLIDHYTLKEKLRRIT